MRPRNVLFSWDVRSAAWIASHSSLSTYCNKFFSSTLLLSFVIVANLFYYYDNYLPLDLHCEFVFYYFYFFFFFFFFYFFLSPLLLFRFF